MSETRSSSNNTGKNVRVRGKWWHYQFEVNGRKYAGNTGLAGEERNRTAAENYAERKRQSLLNPRLIPSPLAMESDEARRRKPFSEAAGEFIVWARDVEYRGKPNTSERLKVSMSSCVLYFGDCPVSQIDASHLEGYKQFRITEHGVRDITLRHDLHALSVFFRYAIKKLWCARNVVESVTIPSDRDAVREHVVSAEEEDEYLATALVLHAAFVKSRQKSQRSQALPNMHDLAVLMLEQGARPEELLAARKEHVDLAAGTLRIAGGKTRAAKRMLNLTERSIAVMERRVQSDGPWLFPSDRRPGQHLTKLQNTHDRICVEAGVSFVIYDFRHTFATRMIASGVDAPTVAAIMGHSGLRTIFRYVHPTADMQRNAMAKFSAARQRPALVKVG